MNKKMIFKALLLGIYGIMLLFYGYYLGEHEAHSNCPIFYADSCINVSDNKTISLYWLLKQSEKFSETTAFCKSKGYDSGIGDRMKIYCHSQGRYHYYPILKDFAIYEYEKYKK